MKSPLTCPLTCPMTCPMKCLMKFHIDLPINRCHRLSRFSLPPAIRTGDGRGADCR